MMSSDFKIKFYSDAFLGNVHDLFMVKRLTGSALDVFYQLLSVYLGCKSLPSELKQSVTYSTAIGSGVLELSISAEKALSDKFGIASEATFELTPESTNYGERVSDGLAKLLYQGLLLRKYANEMSESNIEPNIVIDIAAHESSPSVIKTEQGNIVLKDPKILWASKMTKRSTDKLFSMLKNGGLTGMRVDGLTKPMYFDEKQDSLIRRKTKSLSKELSATAKIVGKINNLFFTSQSGTVISRDKIYSITWSDESRSKIIEHADREGIEFILKPVINQKNLHASIIKYEVIDCFVSQSSVLAG